MDSKIILIAACLALESTALLFMLAGVGALQNICDNAAQEADMSCDSAYRYQWWLVIFNAAVQIGECLRHSLRNSHHCDKRHRRKSRRFSNNIAPF